ncbi:MAG: HAD hydrolase family protein [bacterium]
MSGALPWYDRTPAQEKAAARDLLGPDLSALFGSIKLVVLDADGIMTTGAISYGPGGEALKEFNSRDGLGLVLARTVGLKRAVLTGRNSEIVARRCRELRFDSIKLGRFDKRNALAEILAETGVQAAETLYMGDDLIDLPVLHAVGLPATVPEAPAEVRERCRYVTTAGGGRGAVREVLDLILKASGLFGESLARIGQEAWHPRREDLSSDEKG